MRLFDYFRVPSVRVDNRESDNICRDLIADNLIAMRAENFRLKHKRFLCANVIHIIKRLILVI